MEPQIVDAEQDASSKYEIRKLTIDEILPTLYPVMESHYDEFVIQHRDLMVIKPDFDKYKALEAKNALIMFGVFLGDEMVGYSINFLDSHIHYADLVLVRNDMIYIMPKHRVGRVGLMLIKGTEDAAREAGAKLITWHIKPETNMQAMLPKLGYGLLEYIFSKEL